MLVICVIGEDQGPQFGADKHDIEMKWTGFISLEMHTLTFCLQNALF